MTNEYCVAALAQKQIKKKATEKTSNSDIFNFFLYLEKDYLISSNSVFLLATFFCG